MKIVHIAPKAPYNNYWGYQDNLLPKYQRKLGHDVTMIVTNTMHKDGKIILIHNVVGIDKKDLKVSTKTENQITYLCINGKTKDELTGQEYFINSKFSVKSIITDKVTSELKNGLLYITIPCEDKNSEEKNIEIK